MNIIRVMVTFFSTLVLFACTGTSTSNPSQVKHNFFAKNQAEFVYMAKNGSMLNVFNMTKFHFSTESISYIKRRNFQYGEFGGSIKDCSTDEFYCLIGGLGIVIPKKFTGQSEWKFLDEICRSESPLADKKTAIITCVSKGWANKFVYSSGRGVISYVTSAEPAFEYELIDEKGLFSQ